MSAIRFPCKSPSIKRDVKNLLESIPFTEKEEMQKVVALCLQHLVDAKQAQLVFMKLFDQGLKERNPEILLSSVQAYNDELASIIAGKDEHLARVIESKSTVVTERIANRMTDGAFRIMADSGNTFRDIEVRRALAERLRDVAEEVIKSCDDVVAEEVEANVQELLTEDKVSVKPLGSKV
jgi:hypothetical protein